MRVPTQCGVQGAIQIRPITAKNKSLKCFLSQLRGFMHVAYPKEKLTKKSTTKPKRLSAFYTYVNELAYERAWAIKVNNMITFGAS